MTCCLPFLSGILPPSASDKLIVDVRGGAADTSAGAAQQTPMAGFLGLFGVGKKSADEDVIEEGPYEEYYRIWYGKGLLCFKPKSLGGSGSAVLVKRLDEESAQGSHDATDPASASNTPSSNGSPVKAGHDWSKQSSVESQSQTEGRSLRNYWEERSHTSPTEAAPKAVQVEQ